MNTSKPFLLLKKINGKILSWLNSGSSVYLGQEIRPEMIRLYAKKYHYNIFIETGTLFGDTTNALRSNFKQLFSIELSDDLYEKAKVRFKLIPQITVLHGDSGQVLPGLLQNIKEPAIFYLDGHYSGGVTAKANIDTPIENEIRAILQHHVKDHIILIDDARLFVGENGYPTIKNLISTIIKSETKKHFDIQNDMIIIVPAKDDAVTNSTWKQYREPWKQRAYRSYRKFTLTVKKKLESANISSSLKNSI